MSVISTIRPGLLVVIKTSVVGNVTYLKHDLERNKVDEKTSIAKWETERTIADVEEYERALKVRSEAAYLIRRICANTAFGSLCPEDRADDLAKAIGEAREMVDTFNASANITRARLYVIAGRIAQDDLEAARAIRAELVDVIADMERGVAAMTPDKIRDAARKATELASMLTDGSQKRVEEAVTAARTAANAIMKAARAGEQAALVIDEQVVARISTARLAFLDIDDNDDAPAPAIAQPAVAARALDMGA